MQLELACRLYQPSRVCRIKTFAHRTLGMTEVTIDTTDRNDRPVAVGCIGNYAAA